jgi:TonB family protein
MASACLHAGVAVPLLSRMPKIESVVPVGIEMIYMGETQRFVKSNPEVIKTREVTAEKSEHKKINEVRPAAPAAPLVSTSSLAGPVGRRDGAVVSAIERYKYELRLFLESRKIYPESAKRLRQTGKVVVHFKVSNDGRLSEIGLEQPSPSAILNRAAMDLVTGASKFKPMPADTELTELQLSLPIEYIL